MTTIKTSEISEIECCKMLCTIHYNYNPQLIELLTKYCTLKVIRFNVGAFNCGIRINVQNSQADENWVLGTIIVCFPLDCAIQSLKNFLCLSGYMEEGEEIKFNDTLLDGSKTLSDYGVKEFDTITIYPPLGSEEIIVTSTKSRSRYLRVPLSGRAKYIMYLVYLWEGIPIRDQRLVFSQIQLNINDTLDRRGVKSGSRINVMLRLLGGGVDSNFLDELKFDRYLMKNVQFFGKDVYFLPYTSLEEVPFYSILRDAPPSRQHNRTDLIKEYTIDLYKVLNLRLLVGAFRLGEDDELINKAKLLRLIIRRSYQSNLPNKVFRRVRLSDEELKSYKELKGKSFYLASFTSTSRELRSVKVFGHSTMVFLLKPRKRKNVMDVQKMSAYPGEAEILLNPLSRCIVYDVDLKNKIVFVEFED